MRNSATNFENWRRKISYQTRNFRNGTRKISGNIDLGCAICKLSSLEHACASKNPDILKIQNKHFYSPYSNETFYIKALEYKEYFTHINLWRILKNLDAFRRYSTFSPYENTECLAKR
jgi:hypothetical protein